VRLLGDGFYEQQLIRQQIVDLTGRVLLDPAYVDANAQYSALLDNGWYAAEDLELAVGVTLTADQINNLTNDIVWMVEQEVAGEIVLVPQLYLSPQSANLNSVLMSDNRGALIGAGGNLINNGGSIVNSGTLYGGNDVLFDLNENGIQNLDGNVIAENTLHIKSEGDIKNVGGTLQGDEVILDSIGDIVNQRWAEQRDYQQGGVHEWHTSIGNAAVIRGADSVTLNAGKNIDITASEVHGGAVTLDAQGNINIGTVADNSGRQGTYYGGTLSESRVRHLSSDISSTIKLIANDLTVMGSNLASDGDIQLSSGNDLIVASVANSDSYNFLARHDGETSHRIDRTVRHQSSTITGKGNVSLKSGNNLTVIASELEASEDLSLMGAGDLSLLAELDSDYRYRYEEDDKWYGSKIKTETAYDETARVVELSAGGNVQINARADNKTGKITTSDDAKGNVILEGTQINADGDSLVYAGEDLYITAAREQSYHHSETRREYSGWVNDAAGVAGTIVSFAGVGATIANSGQGISFDLAGRTAKGQTQQRLVDTTFAGAGTTYLLSGEGLTLEAGDYRGDNLMMSSGLNEDSTASTQILGLQTHNSRYSEETTYRFGQTEGFGSLSTQSEETRSQQQNITRWHGTKFDITDDVNIHSAGDLVVQGANVSAGGDANFSAVGGIYLLAGQSATSHSDAVSSDANLGEYTEEQRNSSTVRSEVTSINAGGDVKMHSFGDQVYQGSVIKNDGDQTYTSEAGSVSFLAVTDTIQTSHTEQSSDFSWVTMKSEGSLDETARMVSLQPGGDLIINAANGINVDLRQINSQTGPELVATLVEQNPEMAWLQQLSDQGDINWNEVQEVHERWSDESENLGAGASAVIAIVVTVFTAGAGTGAAGALTTEAFATAYVGTTSAIAAASGAMITSAAVSLTTGTINNGGKLDRSLSDLGQKDSLRGLAVSGLTAGVSLGIDAGFEHVGFGKAAGIQSDTVLDITKGFKLDSWKGMAGFTLHSATQGLASSAINYGVYGGHFNDYLTSNMESQGNNVLSAWAFNAVGNYADGEAIVAGMGGNLAGLERYAEGGIGRTLLHAGVGGILTDVTGGEFKTGFAAAGLNQFLSGTLDSAAVSLGSSTWGTEAGWRTAGSQLAGLFGAALVEGDVNDGAWIAKQADTYNRQLHVSELKLLLTSEKVDAFAKQQGLTRDEAVGILAKNLAWRVDAGWNDEAHIMAAFDPAAQAVLDAFAAESYTDADGRLLFQKEFDYDVAAYDNELMYADGLASNRWMFDPRTVFYATHVVSDQVRNDLYGFNGGAASQGIKEGGQAHIDETLSGLASMAESVAEHPLEAFLGISQSVYENSTLALMLDPVGYYDRSMESVDSAQDSFDNWHSADERAALSMLHGNYAQAGNIATGETLTNINLSLMLTPLGATRKAGADFTLNTLEDGIKQTDLYDLPDGSWPETTGNFEGGHGFGRVDDVGATAGGDAASHAKLKEYYHSLDEGLHQNAASKGYSGIKVSENGNPDFSGSRYLYETSTDRNIVTIELQGSRYQDFKLANELAGFPGAKAPPNFTWHHLDDFDPLTGTSTIQLIEQGAHKATYSHYGSVRQYEQYHGVKYK
jgi:Possible hemagglutinin (DUF637)/A nuclease of the HNH/ENDO VII superfamily with conserved WHH/Hemagglutinin repeat